jgi:hypothetical protein
MSQRIRLNPGQIAGTGGYCLRLRTEGSVAVPCPVRASRSRAAVGSVFGLIRLRSPTFIGVRINAAMQVADVNGIQRTIIPSPENRKVVGSPAAAFPSLSALRCGLDARAAQETYRSRKPQRSDQRVGKSGGHDNRFYPDPRVGIAEARRDP